MKTVFITLVMLVCLGMGGYAKAAKRIKQPRLYTKSTELNENTVQENGIKKIISRHPKSETLLVKYMDGTKKEIPKSSVWGFRDKYGRNYRLYNNRNYQVRAANDVVVYNSDKNRYFFSKDANSALYTMRNKNLESVLGDSVYMNVRPEIRKLRAEKAGFVTLTCLLGFAGGVL